ncbi:MAG: sensor domain-containing diguanylate cyclase [Gammaproteobacteria bacterium]|nr:sensor domain-containing diguanylate cyclase [Gammaproteobacteria bacterium]
MIQRLCWLMLLCSQLLCGSALAGALRITPAQASQNVHAAADVLEDASGQLNLQDLLSGGAADGFRPAGSALSSFGFTRSAHWYRFTLDNPGNTPQRRLLVLRTPWLDTVHLYSADAQGGFQERLVGDDLPFSARDHLTPAFVLDVTVAPGRHTHYLRVSSRQAFMTPIELWQPEAFAAEQERWAAYYGMFYGILLVMVLYNGLIWLWTREPNYAWYCLYLLAFSAMNASYSGFAFQFFWPDSPTWSNLGHTVFIFVFQVTATLFSMTFLESRKRLPRLHRVLQGFLVLLLACWLGVTWWGNPVAYNAAPVNFIFLGTPLILAAGLAAWWNGYRAARFFVLATMVSLSGALCTALTVSGWLPYTFATFHAAEFGILIDVVLLSLALGDRIKLLRDQHHATQQAMLEQKLHASDMLAQVNAGLERTVQERTAELARARDEAERQARTDGLTGVANRRCFEEVAAREVARAQRYQQPLSIILFDIDLFKQVNDLHGHAAGDAVIRTAASVVREAIREVDFVARVGGEEFAILLPGIHQAQAVTTAERLRELIAEREAVHQDLRLRLTASLGVSECRADDPGFGALLHRADQAMYVAKQRGRNRVAVAPDAPGAPDVPEAPAA